MIITLCGSYKFTDEMKSCYVRLSEQSHIVLCPVGPKHNMTIEALHALHDKKIEMSDAIYVVDVGGYFGENTNREIEYAKKLNKKILYYSKGQ